MVCLIVSSNRRLRSQVREVLRQAGYSIRDILSVRNEEEFSQCLREQSKIAVAVVDIHFATQPQSPRMHLSPNSPSYCAIRTLKRWRTGCTIIALTHPQCQQYDHDLLLLGAKKFIYIAGVTVTWQHELLMSVQRQCQQQGPKWKRYATAVLSRLRKKRPPVFQQEDASVVISPDA